MTYQEINVRLEAIRSEVEDDNADLNALEIEVKDLLAERSALECKANQRAQVLQDLTEGKTGTVVGQPNQQGVLTWNNGVTTPERRKEEFGDKIIFRSGEKISDKYTADIDPDKCLRAAITGNRDLLSESEKRAVTPSTGGALLAPELSSQIIDNLRQSNWIELFQPTMVVMNSNEVKIPKISGLPNAIMHQPGVKETPGDPTIVAATLNAKTLMVLVEVANELLEDSSVSHNVIMQACTEAASNKLLQQVLYGTGADGEMKGITLYDGFADSGDKSAEKDLFKLATQADTAIIKSNGQMNSMMYDPDLEDRMNKRLLTGELVEPSRAFARLYDAGRTLAHPSVASGDMLFMQSDALFIGMRNSMMIEVDRSSAFDSFNTKFRLIMRGDIFANVSRMVYFDSITVTEPE